VLGRVYVLDGAS